MAAANFAEEVLAEFYGNDVAAGVNHGAPAQAKLDKLKQDGFFLSEEFEKSDDECDYWLYDDDDPETEEEQKKREEE